MNHKQLHRHWVLILAILLGLGLVGGTLALAQYQSRALTEVSDEKELAALEAQGEGMMPAAYISGVTTGLPPDENPVVEGAAAPAGVDATFKYYTVSGATLRGRSSSATYTYASLGCVYTPDVDNADRLLNTELHIPDNATIKYLRLYYYDTSNTARARGYITYYDPGTSANDLISINDFAMDAAVPGYGFVVSEEVTHTVNNVTNAYTLIGWPTINTNAIQICGLRVAYYDPVVYSVALPLIRK